MRDRLERTSSSWREAAERSPVAKRLEPWADSLLAAARESLACGLEVQARGLAERVEARLESVLAMPSHDSEPTKLEAEWKTDGLPATPGRDRETKVWRRVRALRAVRLPFQGEQHPAAMGLAWGPYNRQSAVAEALKAAARVDPLWVDDFLEREKAMRALDGILGGK